MAAVRGRGNRSTELRLCTYFRELGIRGFRRHVVIEGTRPDFVFARARVVVFADGCFWHGCPRHYTKPVTRAAFWRAKVAENRARDRRHVARLRRLGWSVWRVWECRIEKLALPGRLLARLQAGALVPVPDQPPAASIKPRARSAAAPRRTAPRR